MSSHSFVTAYGINGQTIAECRHCGAHRSDVPCMTESDRINLEARVRQLEAELNQPKHRRWQAPINPETP